MGGSKFKRVNTPIPPTIVIIPYRFSSFSEGYTALTWRDAHVLPGGLSRFFHGGLSRFFHGRMSSFYLESCPGFT